MESQRSRTFRRRLKQRFLKSIEAKSINNIYNCFYCETKLEKHQITIDHLIPKSKGGSDHFNNLAICCISCNEKKADKTFEEFYYSNL